MLTFRFSSSECCLSLPVHSTCLAPREPPSWKAPFPLLLLNELLVPISTHFCGPPGPHCAPIRLMAKYLLNKG